MVDAISTAQVVEFTIATVELLLTQITARRADRIEILVLPLTAEEVAIMLLVETADVVI